jgi:hypothetical protein
MIRIDVYTDADGDHVELLIDGVRSPSRLFTSRSLDPANPAVWLDGSRVFGVDLHWNGVYQFHVPELIEPTQVPRQQRARGAGTSAF